MGIQSTVRITRERAEQRLVEKLILQNYKHIIEAHVKLLSDSQIEDALEEQFDNFSIVEEEDV
jgi:hypothetical protein